MHDERFKKLLQEFFAEFFWLFFPDWAARFDFNSLAWLDKELMSDALAGGSRYVDLVAKLRTLEPVPGPDGRAADGWVALVHVEIEAADRVAPLRRRMFHYYEPLRRRHDFAGAADWCFSARRSGRDRLGLVWGHQLVRFNYPYVGLPALDAEQYLRQDNWLGVALAALMRVPRERKIELAGEALERLVHCPENAYRRTLLCECVSAYLPTDENQREDFENMLRNHPDPGVQAMELGLLDHVEQRGEERGVLKGQRELIRGQLEERFGALPRKAVADLEALAHDRLMQLGRALLSAKSLKELGLGGS